LHGGPDGERQLLDRAHLQYVALLPGLEPFGIGEFVPEHPVEVAAELSSGGDGGFGAPLRALELYELSPDGTGMLLQFVRGPPTSAQRSQGSPLCGRDPWVVFPPELRVVGTRPA
jgi:hypothetical protein